MATSLLDGVDELVDRLISTPGKGTPPRYRHKANHQGLNTSQLDGPAMVRALYDRVCANWSAAETRVPSRQNWRWRKMLEVGDGNSSPEKHLEKAIARYEGEDWVNQIPTASGVVGSEERQRNIDLGHRLAPGHFELIELKVVSNTPLHAVVECLGYAVVYLFSRAHRGELEYDALELMEAHTVDFRILAPDHYYIPCNRPSEFCALVGKIDHGLSKLARELGLGVELTFGAEAFSAPADPGSAESVAAVLATRESVC